MTESGKDGRTAQLSISEGAPLELATDRGELLRGAHVVHAGDLLLDDRSLV